MARRKKIEAGEIVDGQTQTVTADVTGKKIETLQAVASTVTDKKKDELVETSETVTIACHLPFAVAFDDVPDGGSKKTIVFPSINENLRGQKRAGILLGKGECIAVTILRKDWDNIVAMHGDSVLFKGDQNSLPLLIPMKDTREFESRRDELAEISHGLEAADPAKLGVMAKPASDD